LSEKPTAELGLFDSAFGYGQLPSLTGFLLRKASVLDFGNFGEAVGDRTITPLRYSVLEVVGANPGLQQVQLAAILGLTKPAATLAIDFWQSRNCIARRQDRKDRRSHGVYLTPAGEDTLAELQKLVARHDRGLTASLSASELGQLHSLLQRIVASQAEEVAAV